MFWKAVFASWLLRAAGNNPSAVIRRPSSILRPSTCCTAVEIRNPTAKIAMLSQIFAVMLRRGMFTGSFHVEDLHAVGAGPIADISDRAPGLLHIGHDFRVGAEHLRHR